MRTFFFLHISQALAILLRFGSVPPSSDEACPGLNIAAGMGVPPFPRKLGDGLWLVGEGERFTMLRASI